MKEENEYKQLIISCFSLLIDIYVVDNAIILIYQINKVRGHKI